MQPLPASEPPESSQPVRTGPSRCPQEARRAAGHGRHPEGAAGKHVWRQDRRAGVEGQALRL